MIKTAKKGLALMLSLMMVITTVATSTTFGASATSLQKYGVVDNLSNFKITGRYAVKADSITFDNTAEMLEFNFNGSGDVTADLRVNTSDGAYLTVYVDGQRQQNRVVVSAAEVAETDVTVTLASQLAAGDHNIKVYRSNEAAQATIDFKSVNFAGDLKEKPADKKLYIEVLGDSITAGYGSMVHGSEGSGEAASSDGTLTYAFDAAQRLDADLQVVARSGMLFAEGNIYITKDAANGNPGEFGVVNSIDDYLNCINPSRNKTDKFDVSSARQPDVFVINLGTNDASCQAKLGYTDQTMIERATDLIKKVRAMYPNTKIVWYYGMMGAAMTANIKAGIEAANDDNTYFVSARLSNYEGGGGHPSKEAHVTNGRYLASKINALFNGPGTGNDPFADAAAYPLDQNGNWTTPNTGLMKTSTNGDNTWHFYQNGNGWVQNLTEVAKLKKLDLSHGFRFTAAATCCSYNFNESILQVQIGDYVIASTYAKDKTVTVSKDGTVLATSEALSTYNIAETMDGAGYGLQINGNNCYGISFEVTMDAAGTLTVKAANPVYPEDTVTVFSEKVDVAAFKDVATTLSWRKGWTPTELYNVNMYVLGGTTEPEPPVQTTQYPLDQNENWTEANTALMAMSTNGDNTWHFYQNGNGTVNPLTEAAKLKELDLSHGFHFTATAMCMGWNYNDNVLQVQIGDYVIASAYATDKTVTVSKDGTVLATSAAINTQENVLAADAGLQEGDGWNSFGISFDVTLDADGTLTVKAANHVHSGEVTVYSEKVDTAAFKNAATSVSWKKGWTPTELYNINMTVTEGTTEPEPSSSEESSSEASSEESSSEESSSEVSSETPSEPEETGAIKVNGTVDLLPNADKTNWTGDIDNIDADGKFITGTNYHAKTIQSAKQYNLGTKVALNGTVIFLNGQNTGAYAEYKIGDFSIRLVGPETSGSQERKVEFKIGDQLIQTVPVESKDANRFRIVPLKVEIDTVAKTVKYDITGGYNEYSMVTQTGEFAYDAALDLTNVGVAVSMRDNWIAVRTDRLSLTGNASETVSSEESSSEASSEESSSEESSSEVSSEVPSEPITQKATLSLKVEDQDGNAVSELKTGDTFYLAFYLSDYDKLIGTVSGDVLDRVIANANVYVEVDNAFTASGWDSPYKAKMDEHSGSVDVKLNQGVLAAFVQTDRRGGLDYAITADDLAANQGLFFRLALTANEELSGKTAGLVETVNTLQTGIALISSTADGAFKAAALPMTCDQTDVALPQFTAPVSSEESSSEASSEESSSEESSSEESSSEESSSEESSSEESSSEESSSESSSEDTSSDTTSSDPGPVEPGPHKHTWTSRYEAATTTKNGKEIRYCSGCNLVASTKTIRAASRVSLSETAFVYSGEVCKPTVNVATASGVVIAPSNYTVSYSNENPSAVGKYNVVITFKEQYSGSVTRTYSIVPGGVSGLKHNAVTTRAIRITWNKAVEAGAYSVFYSTTGKGAFELLGDTTATSYTVKSLQPGKTYYFKVRPFKADGKFKIYGAVTKIYATSTLPVAPAVKFHNATTSSITVKWNAISGVSGYQLCYSTSKNGKFTKVTTAQKARRLSSMKPATTYYFKARSYRIVGGKTYFSAYSPVVAFSTLPKTPTAKVSTTSKTITVKWSKVPGVTGYQVSYGKVKTGTYATKTVKNTVTSLKLSKLKSGTSYHVWVRSYRTVGGKNYYSPYCKRMTIKCK